MPDGARQPLGVVVFGVSTPFAYWGFHHVRALVEALTGHTLHLHVSNLEQLQKGIAARAGGSAVISSDFPDAALAQFVCRSGLPLIVFADEATTLLDWLMESRGLAPLDAARFGSRICAALAPIVATPSRLIVARSRDLSPERITSEILAFLWPQQSQRLGFQEPSPDPWPLVEPPQINSDEMQRGAALSALSGYSGLVEGRGVVEFFWPHSLFTRPDTLAWATPVDLTGPARAVLYGPYMHLPVGSWSARVEFEIDGAASGVEAMTDVRMNEVVTQKLFQMPAKGVYAYELGFEVKDPHHPVEIRLFTKKSAIEGKFLLRSVVVTPWT